jgi:diaminopimelate decarboxylase/aspartate kinase
MHHCLHRGQRHLIPITHMPIAPVSDSRWLVLKFGGTSVSKRTRWDTIGRLASERATQAGARVLVVVSALSGVTNELTAICAGDGIGARIDALIERHRGFCGELELDADGVLGERIAALQALANDPRAASLALVWQAEVLAQGELLSSTIGAAYLRAQATTSVGAMRAIGWMRCRCRTPARGLSGCR